MFGGILRLKLLNNKFGIARKAFVIMSHIKGHSDAFVNFVYPTTRLCQVAGAETQAQGHSHFWAHPLALCPNIRYNSRRAGGSGVFEICLDVFVHVLYFGLHLRDYRLARAAAILT